MQYFLHYYTFVRDDFCSWFQFLINFIPLNNIVAVQYYIINKRPSRA